MIYADGIPATHSGTHRWSRDRMNCTAMCLPQPDYERGDVRLYRADCLELLPKLPDGCVDAVVTDPPYGVGKATWDVRYPFGFEEEAFRIARSVFIMPGLTALPQCLLAMGTRYRGIIAARNLNGMTFSPLGFGNWIPIVCGGDVLRGQDSFELTVESDKPDHPSPKPIRMIEWLIEGKTNSQALVCDPFMGSGTTGVACARLGRKFIEIEPKYFDIACKRIDEAFDDFGLLDPVPKQEKQLELIGGPVR